MALPEQVVERLSREPVQTPGWSSRLLMFAGTIFFITLAIYFGLTFGYKPYLDNQVKQLDDQIQKFTQEIPISDQNQLAVFYSQLANLDGILRGHVISSPLFDWLGGRTQSNIAYAKFNFAARTGQLALNGVAKTMNDFIQQLQIFQAESLVQRINVNSLTVSSNGGWQFDMMLFLDQTLLSQLSPPQSSSSTPQSSPSSTLQ